MKLVIGAYPAKSIDIHLVYSYKQPIDMEPIEKASVGMDDFLPTIKNFCANRNIDEALIVGPKSFTQHLANKITTIFPDMKISIGEKKND